MSLQLEAVSLWWFATCDGVGTSDACAIFANAFPELVVISKRETIYFIATHRGNAFWPRRSTMNMYDGQVANARASLTGWMTHTITSHTPFRRHRSCNFTLGSLIDRTCSLDGCFSASRLQRCVATSNLKIKEKICWGFFHLVVLRLSSQFGMRSLRSAIIARCENCLSEQSRAAPFQRANGRNNKIIPSSCYLF